MDIEEKEPDLDEGDTNSAQEAILSSVQGEFWDNSTTKGFCEHLLREFFLIRQTFWN